MSQRPPDLRVRRTRALLRDALVGLIEERGFDRVTVAQITERAMVSRAAFYRNYRDKYQLVEQIFEDAIAELVGNVADADERPVDQRWLGFFVHIDHYHRLYRALLGGRGSPWFVDRMRATMSAMTAAHLPDTRPGTGIGAGAAPADDLGPSILAAIFVQTITWWLDNDRPYPPNVVAERSARVAALVIDEARTWRR